VHSHQRRDDHRMGRARLTPATFFVRTVVERGPVSSTG
jgi:hypothetical protein